MSDPAGQLSPLPGRPVLLPGGWKMMNVEPRESICRSITDLVEGESRESAIAFLREEIASLECEDYPEGKTMDLPPMKRNGDRLESDLVLVTFKSGTKVLGRLVHIDGFPRPEWCTCPDGREFKCLSVASWEPLPTDGAR